MNKLKDNKKSHSTGIDVADIEKDSIIDFNNIISINKTFIKESFSGLTGFIEIREITDSGAKKRYFKTVDDLLEYDPPADKNIYIGMLTRDKKRGKAVDTVETKLIWLDFDDKDSYYSFEHLVNLNKLPEPAFIVGSGHGYHAHYILDKPAGREVESVVKELARKVGADTRATDLARIMRVPGTVNVKNPDEPVRCEVLRFNNNRIKLKDLADVLGVKPEVVTDLDKGTKTAAAAYDIDYKGIKSSVNLPCVKAMLDGVPEGERNWALGRITKYLKKAGYYHKEAKKMVKVWNMKNDPPEKEEAVLNSFESYWHDTDWKLLGCNLKKYPDLQQILNKYCDRSECPLTNEIQFDEEIEEGDSLIEINNRVLNKIKEFAAYELIIYGVLGMNSEGITAERGADIIGITEKTFRKHASSLADKGYATKIEGIKRRKIKDIFHLSRQGTFKLGYSYVSYSTLRFLNSELKAGGVSKTDVKVYLLLRYYEYKSKTGEVYPATTTLAEKLNTSRTSISRSINKLEKQDIIEIDRQTRRSNVYRFKMR